SDAASESSDRRNGAGLCLTDYKLAFLIDKHDIKTVATMLAGIAVVVSCVDYVTRVEVRADERFRGVLKNTPTTPLSLRSPHVIPPRHELRNGVAEPHQGCARASLGSKAEVRAAVYALPGRTCGESVRRGVGRRGVRHRRAPCCRRFRRRRASGLQQIVRRLRRAPESYGRLASPDRFQWFRVRDQPRQRLETPRRFRQ